MNERDKLIQLLISEKGGTVEDYNKIMDAIAYHESAHTMDPTIRQSSNSGEGPGRGKYQFEEGKNRGGITAARRLRDYYNEKKVNIPKWLSKVVEGDSLDATSLTSAQQDMLFLGDIRIKPNADFSKVFNGEKSIPDFWADHHWAGNQSDRNTRIKSFNESFEKYKEVGPETVRKLAFNNSISNENPYYNQQIGLHNPEMNQVISNATGSNRFGNSNNLNDMLAHVQQEQQQQQQMSMAQPQQQSRPYSDKELTRYNNGGTHEQNPLGGIPIGNKSVEAPETSYNLSGGKFVFSDRVNLNGSVAPKLDGANQQVSNSYNNQFAYGGEIDPIKKYKKQATDERGNTLVQQDNTYIKPFKLHSESLQPTQEQVVKQPVQPMLYQDNRTESQRKADYEKAQRINNASVGSSVGNIMKAPLLYLNNPMKIAGDLGVDNWLRGLGATKDLFPTTDEDYKRYARIQERTDISNAEKINMLQNEAYGLVPDAALNTAFSVMGANSLSNAALQSFDPIGVTGNNIKKANQQVLKPNSRNSKSLMKTSPNEDIKTQLKNAFSNPDADIVNSKSPRVHYRYDGGLPPKELEDLLNLDSMTSNLEQHSSGNLKDHLRFLARDEGLDMDIYNKLIDDLDVNKLSFDTKEKLDLFFDESASYIDEYFSQMDSPKMQKKLKDFSNEYGVDLVKEYEKHKSVTNRNKSDMVRLDYNSPLGETGSYGVDFEMAFGKNRKLPMYESNRINLNPSLIGNGEELKKTMWHELSHSFNRSIIDNPKILKELDDIFYKDISSIPKEKTNKTWVGDFQNAKLDKDANEQITYFTQPEEVWSHLSTNLKQDLKREGLIKDFHEPITLEHLDKVQSSTITDYLPLIKDKDKLLNLINKMTLGLAPIIGLGAGAASQNSFAYGGNMDLVNNHLQSKQVKKNKKKK